MLCKNIKSASEVKPATPWSAIGPSNLENVLQENNIYWFTFQDAENSKAILDEKFSQQNEEISDLKYELCQAEDEKDEAVKSAIDQQKEEFSTLKTTIVELETQLKELQATSTNENIEAIRDKLASQNIELASLRVELKRAEGDKQTANKKAHAEIDMERAQVILLLYKW